MRISILRELENPNNIWEIELVTGKIVKGRVVDWMKDPNGLPMTIVFGDNEFPVIEVPWEKILTISKIQGTNNG